MILRGARAVLILEHEAELSVNQSLQFDRHDS